MLKSGSNFSKIAQMFSSNPCPHSEAASFEMAKKFSKDFRTATRTPLSRASKQAFTWYVWSSGPKIPFMASFIQTRSRSWPIKGLGLASPDYQVGAHFEALDKGVLVAASKSIETFFAISTFPELRCASPIHTFKLEKPYIF